MSMRSKVAIVGVGRTPYSRAKPGEPVLTADDYIAWAAESALKQAGLTKNDFNGQGLGVAHAEVAHTVNWSAATAENLGISPEVLLRADQGGASASSMLIRAAAMIEAGIVDRVLVVGADTPLNIPSAAPGLPLSPERTRGIYWDFQGPFGVMGATAQFGLVLTRYMHQFPSLSFEQLGKIAVASRYNAGFHPGAIYRKPFTLDEYLDSKMLSDPIRLLDCVPIVNGGLAYIVTSEKTARTLTDKPVFLRGFGEMNNYYHGSRAQPDVTTTGFAGVGAEGDGDGRREACRHRPVPALRRLPLHRDDDPRGLGASARRARAATSSRSATCASTATSRSPPTAASSPAASPAARSAASCRSWKRSPSCATRRASARSRTPASPRPAASAASPMAVPAAAASH